MLVLFKLVLLILLSGLHFGCASTRSSPTSNQTPGQHSPIITTSDSYSLTNNSYSQRDVNTQISRVNTQLRSTPNDPKLLKDLAELYVVSGNYTQAVELAKKSIRLDVKNSDAARKVLAQAYYRSGQLDLASITLNTLGGVDSRDSDVINILALIAIRKDDPEYGATLLNRAIELAPQAVAPRMNLGLIRMKQFRFSDAAIHFERVLRSSPNHPDARLQLAIAQSNLGDFQKAKRSLESLHKVDNQNPIILFNLAVVHNGLKDYDAAERMLKNYVATDSSKLSRDPRVASLNSIIKSNREKDRQVIEKKQKVQSQSTKVDAPLDLDGILE